MTKTANKGDNKKTNKNTDKLMNKSEFINFMSHDNKDNVVSKVEAEKAFNLVTSHICKALQLGYDLLFTGFGKFKVSKREARVGRNPKTGEEIKIDSYNQPTFSAGKTMKDLCNQAKSNKAKS